MSKYIIDTGDYLFTTDGVLVVGFDCDNKPATFYNSLDNLEELTADYINEHFGDLQDTAYQKGYEDGCATQFKPVSDAEYQRGLDDAWECARKLFSSMADSDIEKAFPVEWNNGGFNALINLQPQEAIAKLKAYEEKQKEDDKIEVGDEVEVLNSGSKYLIAWFAGTSLCGFAHDGVTCRLQPSDVRKTGRHFDIASILEAMKK